jgi:hypothetical protein
MFFCSSSHSIQVVDRASKKEASCVKGSQQSNSLLYLNLTSYWNKGISLDCPTASASSQSAFKYNKPRIILQDESRKGEIRVVNRRRAGPNNVI